MEHSPHRPGAELPSVLAAQLQAVLSAAALPPDSPLVVGVSGGADSLTLLHALSHGLYPRERLVVAHLDHLLRPGSAADAAFAGQAAAAWGLRFVVEVVDVGQLARRRRLSVEEAGRLARYAFLGRTADAFGAPAAAVGHNADDQAESVLMHLLRGTGSAGLRGMAPVGPMPTRPDLTLLRPLLAVPRHEIEAYCRANGLEPMVDESNEDVVYHRNWLRLHLLPLLEEANPGIRERLRQTASLAAAEHDLIQALESEAMERIARAGPVTITLDRAAWLALPLALRRATLRRAAARLRPELRDLGFRAVEQARLLAEAGRSGRRASLPAGIQLEVRPDVLWLWAGQAPPAVGPQLPAGESLTLPVPGQVRLESGWRLRADLLTPAPAEVTPGDPWQAIVDAGPAEALIVRARQPGERFQPLGLGGHSALVSDVMINRKLPAGERALWPIVALPEHLVWIVGHQRDERARVRPDSARPLRLTAVAP
jgi:tRNA(Ile)-lysidine synthase